MKQAALKGAKLITADPRRIELADYGVLHCPVHPGTNAAFLNGLAHVVIRDGLVDEDYVNARTDGYEAIADVVSAYTPEATEELTGVPAEDIVRAAHIYGEAETGSIAWGLGVTEQLYGSECVQLICNLALLTGKLGRPGCALMPLRGQNNVQGSSDMGALPDTYTAYRSVEDDEVSRMFEERWGVEMKRERGLKMPEMFDAAIEGSLKAMWITGYDIVQSDPDVEHVMEALGSLEFLVVQEIFENETSKFANVILPASSFLEKTGTFTNAERRIQIVRAAVDPPGAAKTDLEICSLISSRLGYELGYDGPEDVMAEIAELTPDFAGVTYERLEGRGLQWPVAPDGTGRADPLRGDVRPPPGRPRAPGGAAVQGARRRGERASSR